MATSLPLVFDAPRRAMPPRHLADLDEAGRADAVAALGMPAFRGKQLANQYYGRLIADPHQMTDLPAAVREQVADALFPHLLDAVREIECDAGETRKMLWRAIDGTAFESVLMRYPQRNTVCISSQAGCGMACPFCATGQGGLTRNLSTAEILEQVRAAAVELRDRDHGRLSNIVFMGMGEPLANYNRVLGAVRRIIAAPPNGFGISARAVTVYFPGGRWARVCSAAPSSLPLMAGTAAAPAAGTCAISTVVFGRLDLMSRLPVVSASTFALAALISSGDLPHPAPPSVSRAARMTDAHFLESMEFWP